MVSFINAVLHGFYAEFISFDGPYTAGQQRIEIYMKMQFLRIMSKSAALY